MQHFNDPSDHNQVVFGNLQPGIKGFNHFGTHILTWIGDEVVEWLQQDLYGRLALDCDMYQNSMALTSSCAF